MNVDTWLILLIGLGGAVAGFGGSWIGTRLVNRRFRRFRARRRGLVCMGVSPPAGNTGPGPIDYDG